MVRSAPSEREGSHGGRVVDNGRYKGVRMRKWGKWVAEVRKPNSRGRIWLGSYNTAEEAGRAYDAAVYCLRGPSWRLNFPDDPPRIPFAGELSPSQIREAAFCHARKWEVGIQSVVSLRPGSSIPVSVVSSSIGGYSVERILFRG